MMWKKSAALLLVFALFVEAQAQWGHQRRSRGRGNGWGRSAEQPQTDYYKVLGVPRDANDAVLKRQYRKLAL